MANTKNRMDSACLQVLQLNLSHFYTQGRFAPTGFSFGLIRDAYFLHMAVISKDASNFHKKHVTTEENLSKGPHFAIPRDGIELQKNGIVRSFAVCQNGTQELLRRMRCELHRRICHPSKRTVLRSDRVPYNKAPQNWETWRTWRIKRMTHLL